MSRFVFFTGGVVSSLGKGIAAASLGTMLKSRGFNVSLKKMDPYLNVDAGTMNPAQHGEVFVTEDGGESDLDLGHYERFIGIRATKLSNLTSGGAYQKLLHNERTGEYLGQTVQMIPHLTDLIQDFITKDSELYDFILCEIGGTVGDIEGLPFLEAIRQLSRKVGRDNAIFIHTGLCPYVEATQELKTKPMQHSVRMLMSYGIEPRIILCRTKHAIPDIERRKLSLFCNVEIENVIEAIDLDNIYKAPLTYAKNGLDRCVLKSFNLKDEYSNNDFSYLNHWKAFVERAENVRLQKDVVKIAIVGKYTQSSDAYKSLLEAIYHAGVECFYNVQKDLISADDIFENPYILAEYDGIIVPGGFGKDHIYGKLSAIEFARINKVPMLGICFGMQLSVIEFFRNVLGITDATSAEFKEEAQRSSNVVIQTIREWKEKDGTISKRDENSSLGGTMHLGAYECEIKEGTLMWEIYKQKVISERHRHRYNITISKEMERLVNEHGGVFSSKKLGDNIHESFEINNHSRNPEYTHPFFIGVQFHPEFQSSPLKAHPLFTSLIKAAAKKYSSKKD